MRHIIFVVIFFVGVVSVASAAPKMELLPFWAVSNEQSAKEVDHSDWQQLLDRYLDNRHPSGISRFDYASVSALDLTVLANYSHRLQSTDPRQLNKAEQKAYWINLYNALIVTLILDQFPVASIKKTGNGFFSFGPWNDPVAKVQGKSLSLNQIEHGILRPIWRDNRIHYAVNCASLGCPNLQARVFTATSTEFLLELAAAEYINHFRGVDLTDGELKLSSIYQWYQEDFGGDEQGVLRHLLKYAKPELAKGIDNYQGSIKYRYDWSLNSP